MEIVNFTKISYDNSSDKLPLTGDSLCNNYIPFISLFTGQFFKKEDKRLVVYNLLFRTKDPTDSRRRSFTIPKTSYEDLFSYLCDYIYPQYYITDKVELQVSKGTIIEYDRFTNEYKILMLLVVKKEFVWNINKDKPDPKQFTLIISNTFVNEEKYSTLFKRLEKDYITEAITQNIDIIYTNDIVKHCYKYTFNKPKFKSVSEMMSYLDSLNTVMHSNEIEI